MKCCLGIFAAALAAGCTCEVSESVTETFGPVANRSDQIRLFVCAGGWHDGWAIYDRLTSLGFNMLCEYTGGVWDFEKGAPSERSMTEKERKLRTEYYDRCLADGIGVIDNPHAANEPALISRYPRRKKNGSPNLRNLDALNPKAVAEAKKAFVWQAKEFDHPAIVGLVAADEVRDLAHPTFTPEMCAAYRAHSGRDVPKAVLEWSREDGRQPPHWSKLDDFPKNRIVEDDYPVLDFYRWFWLKGDGWVDFCGEMNRAYADAVGKRLFRYYKPAVRTPAMWGAVGEPDGLGYWAYVYPEPYNVMYNVSELQSRARESGQLVFGAVQEISYRSQLAPIGEHPAGEPRWTAEFPNTKYPTMPPDMLNEGLWALQSHRMDGMSAHGCSTLYDAYALTGNDYYRHDGTFYQCTNPETVKVLDRFMREVGIPLGPLLRKVPERAPTVAVVESYASQILGARITWDCQGKFFDCGVLATAANLMPYAMTEEEIAERGIPASVKTLLMPVCDVLTRRCYERIADFKARGGRIVADEELTPALKADAALPSVERAFAETKSDHDDGTVSPAKDASVREKALKRAAAQLKERAQITPYADADNADIVVHVRSSGCADYVFAINDRRTFGDYVGPWKRVMEKGLPNSGKVTVRRAAGAVYDLVRHEAVPFAVTDGRTEIDVRYTTTDGRLLMVTERPLGGLKVAICGTKVTVRSPDADVLIPIRIEGASKKPFYGVVAGGAWMHDFGHDLEGVSVTDLATGRLFQGK